MKEYTVKELTKMFTKSIILIVGLAVVFGGAFGFLAKHRQSTTYTAHRSVLISHNYQAAPTQNNDQNAQVLADQNLMPTYEELAQGRTVAKETRSLLPKKLQKKYTTDDLDSMIRARSHQQSLILEMKVETKSSAKDAAKLVNAAAEAVQKELPRMKAGIGTVTLLSKATADDVTSETTPKAKKYAVAGAALGGLIGIVVSLGGIAIKDFVRKNGN